MSKPKEQEIIKNTEILESVKQALNTINNPPKSKYIYDEDGKINWFKTIPLEYLYLNESKKNSIEKRLNKSFSEVTKEDALETELIINLAGIRWLLDTLGYKYSKITINSCNPEYAAATCEICFNPSEHNNNLEQIYTQSASAHAGNTKSWYKEYLVEAAANRAFCRAVRFYCNVQCVSSEELGTINQEENTPAPSNIDSQVNTLIEKIDKEMQKRGISFEQLKNVILIGKDKMAGADKFKTLRDIPRDNLFNLYDRIKKAPSEKKEEKE